MRVETPQQNAPAWKVWVALWTVYIVWGSTYLAIRIAVETMPPLLTAGIRFLLAGAIMLTILAVRGKLTGLNRDNLIGAAFVGTALILGGNGLVMVAEQYVQSSLAALMIGSVPLWVILYRSIARDRVPRGTFGGVVLGFIGLALLVLPGDRPGGAPLGGMLLLVAAPAFWATGTFFSRRVALPSDPFLSTGVQMILGGSASLIAGLVRGEAAGLQLDSFSSRSWWAFLYLILIGSFIAFTAYVWVLQHAPVSKVATYAYVNPVVAVFLGWAILSEEITALVLLAAAVIVSSVAFIVRRESAPVRTEASPSLATAEAS